MDEVNGQPESAEKLEDSLNPEPSTSNANDEAEKVQSDSVMHSNSNVGESQIEAAENVLANSDSVKNTQIGTEAPHKEVQIIDPSNAQQTNPLQIEFDPNAPATFYMESGPPLQKYVYSSKFFSKRISSESPTTRLKLKDTTVDFKKFYDLNRNKYDEIVHMSNATNTIIAICASAKSCLQASSDSLTAPVATWYESSVNGLEAWTGVVAEALKLISIESATIEGTSYVNKKRLLSTAKQTVSSKLKEASDRIIGMEKLVDRLGKVLESCSRTISCLNTGCRSRFYQSVWQTSIRVEQGQGDLDFEMSEASNKLHCISSSMSTSSLLSLNLLTPYIRWDVDGISIKKQVSMSWPLIKFSSLSFPNKVNAFSELFAAFLVFLDIPTRNIWNALNALQETSSESREVTLLDRQFHTILTILLSERYFHPVEQHRALICGIKLQKSFALLQAQLDKVKSVTKRLREIWRKAFKNGDLSISAAAFAVDATNIPLWKSCKNLSFQLDLFLEIPNDTRSKFSMYKPRAHGSDETPLTTSHRPKLLSTDFSRALTSHFELLEDYEVSYASRLQELKQRKEFVINESDIRPCSDLAQQLFFHFEHIGSSLNSYTRSLIQSNNILLDSIPTDPSTTPTTYTNFSPLRLFKDLSMEDNMYTVSVTGWMSAVLEMLHSTLTDASFLKLPEVPSLRKKCVQLSKSLVTLSNLINSCIKNYRKAESFMERVLNHIEEYFDPLEDNLKVLSRVSSTDALPVPPDDVSEPHEEESLKKVTNNQDDEVSLIVSLDGIYFNQFGVVFASRLDVTTAEHRLRIVELFVNNTVKQIQDAITLTNTILTKFGSDNFSVQWWKQLLRSHEPAMLIDGSLQENVYGKSIFHLMHNIDVAFSKTNVKASLGIYSELEALILIRTSRILEEEIVRFGKACQFMRQGLLNLEYFRKYFERSCNKFFSGTKFIPPFQHWSNRICCFKLVIQDDTFKNQLDRILTSTASENVSRSPSDTKFTTKVKKLALKKVSSSSALVTISEIHKLWTVNENRLLHSLQEENAFIAETEAEATNSETINLCSAATERKFMSQTEAATILIAHGVTQLKLETFPKRLKFSLLKKIKSVCSKLKECRAVIAHTCTLSSVKTEKIVDRLNTIMRTYSHIHLEETDDGGYVLATTAGQKITPDSKTSDLKYKPSENNIQSEECAEGNELDVLVTLSFAYGSLILSYRGYERTATFRSWSQKPTEQGAMLEVMMENISDRLSRFVEISRKISVEYIQLNRKIRKLSEKIDQSFPLPLSTLTELMSSLKRLQVETQERKLVTAMQVIHDMLEDTGMQLKLTIGFLEKHTEMIKSADFTANDATLAIRNPFEKDIRELFTKPIRIIIPYDKINQKLW